jgi:ubiquinone/menaquinone biosynthesis C-methylase UbiE
VAGEQIVMPAMATSDLDPHSDAQPWNLAADGYNEVLMPWFASYARDALEVSQIVAPATIIDIAAGPGTLSLVAARRGIQVTAVDIAVRMVATLRENAAQNRLHGIDALVATGESLPFGADAFEAAFSMFGVIFFQQPERGLEEMLRVLRPGRPAVISTWQPLETTPILLELIAALAEEGEDITSFLKDEFSQPSELVTAMQSAGFEAVQTKAITHSLFCRSLADVLDRLQRSNPPFVTLRQRLHPQRWTSLWQRVHDRLARTFGIGPQELRYPALLAMARKPVQ